MEGMRKRGRFIRFTLSPALPVPSEVEGSAVEGPALSAVEGPALSAVEGPGDLAVSCSGTAGTDDSNFSCHNDGRTAIEIGGSLAEIAEIPRPGHAVHPKWGAADLRKLRKANNMIRSPDSPMTNGVRLSGFLTANEAEARRRTVALIPQQEAVRMRPTLSPL
jgi:hypothetical protein